MRIQMQHLKQAKNNITSTHSPVQYSMMKEFTGETDKDLALAAMFGKTCTMDWYNNFRRARNEKVYDTQKNRYKGAEA